MRNSAQAASSGNSVWNWASERGRVMPPAYYLRFGNANLHMVGQSAYLGHLGKPKAETDGHLEAGDEPADLRHTESNWKKCIRSGAPFSALILTRITARKAKASIDKVMCRYQPCQLRTS